ncbi:relaxase/mobilization nuclease domain-containing protein [Bradyrhizobium sp. HKCCYLS20291]|uniref:relaxase/mobilization nuclease domain-containing protein n=1 Tax=Bradyrhizobium sp. HKCCYLS20291 TaxID=3420766 RepID=UPI003EB6E393
MSTSEREFRIRPGRIRHGRGTKAKSFINRVLRAANAAGHVARLPTINGRHAVRAHSTFGRGRLSFSRERLFVPVRRVTVKARIARHAGRAFRSAPLATHLAYLQRDGVTRKGEPARMFDAAGDQADEAGFEARGKGDRHHFRFIVSPEDAADMVDLRAFTRDLMRQMEADLSTRLEWIAVDHWNTDNPHVHVLVRGVDETGTDLVISRDYISRGLRSRAEELVAIELGPKPEHEIRNSLEREITADRWTRLDREIRMAADEVGAIDLRQEAAGLPDPEVARLMRGRLQYLERLGLASAAGPNEWMIELGAERKLRELGLRGDVIKTMHQAFAARGEERSVADYAIEGSAAGSPIVGRLVDRGLHDELTGEAYAVIDGVDGRAHHVRFRGAEAFAQAPPVGGIVEVRRFGGADDARPTLLLATRSDLGLAEQITAEGATWLDHRLVEREPMPLALGGFGAETRDALRARAEHLADQGLARRQGQRIIVQRDLLKTLRQRELDSIGARLSAQFNLPLQSVSPGAAVAGTYRQRLALASGRFAMIDNGLGFYLVPWSRELDSRLGKTVTGLAKAGGIEWQLGRKRDLGL